MSAASERRDQAEQVNMRQLGEAVLPLLDGGPWTLKAWPPDSEIESLDKLYANLGRPDGAEVALCLSRWPVDVTVRGGWPKVDGYGEFCPRDRGNISFSPFKSPAAMARDINRRFLATYLAEYEKQKAAAAAYTETSRLAEEMAAELAKIVGGQVRGGGGRVDGWRIWGRRLDIEVTRWGSVKFTATVEAGDQTGAAGQIARMLAALLPEEDGE